LLYAWYSAPIKNTHSNCQALTQTQKVESLIRENIPYSVFGGIRFFERKEIKDVLAYLRLIEFGDDFSFLRVVNTPSRGLGKKFIENVAIIAEKENISLYSALKENILQKDLSRKGAIEFIELIEKYKKSKNGLIISDLVKEIMDESGLSAYYRTDGDTDRLDNIKELQNSIILLETQDEEQINLTEYLQEIALYTNMDIEDDKNDRVKLMTIHTSKGLEFPYVFLCGFTEGVLPSAMSIKERRAKAIEEERRLTYVAITRAEKAFYMTESEGFNFSTGLNKYPSRFLFEISDNYFVRKGELRQEIIDEAKEQLKLDSTRQPIQKKFNVGDIVNHTIWNQGKIIEVNEEKGEYQIEFLETNKIKPINFEFRGLKKIEKPTEHRKMRKGKPKLNIKEKQIEEKNSTNSIEKNTEAKIREFVKNKYPDDIDMQDYENINQSYGYEYMASVADIEIKEYVTCKYKDDFYMQQHIYKKNIVAKKYMNSVTDIEIKEIAKNEYPKDYEMQQHIYEQQITAKKIMLDILESPAKERAVNDFPKDYEMQVHIYEELNEEGINKTEIITKNIEVELLETFEKEEMENSTIEVEEIKDIVIENGLLETDETKQQENVHIDVQCVEKEEVLNISIEDEEVLSPTKYKYNSGDAGSQKDNASNYIWSKLKKLWS
jgi:ATP-dependent DNA helicase UvrD/PcrA